MTRVELVAQTVGTSWVASVRERPGVERIDIGCCADSGGFVENDKRAIRELAELYDPNVPVHENPAYVERTKEILVSHEDAMRGSSAIFGSRNERGWIPPSVDDLETVIAEAADS